MAWRGSTGVEGRIRPWVYGALGLPLAFAALPLYLHLPRFYVDRTELSLAALGSILLLARLLDALLDPWIGGLADRSPRKPWLAVSLTLFALGFLALLNPPVSGAAGWLVLSLTVTYLGFSASTIAYQAWGAELASSAGLQNRLTAAREGFGLMGVLLAAALPALLAEGLSDGVVALAWVLLPLLLGAALISFTGLPSVMTTSRKTETWQGLREVLVDSRLRRLLLVFVVNGLAAALPATLFLFFVADVLQAESLSGPLLALYFASAALSLPLWIKVAARWGRVMAWKAGMFLALSGFSVAGFLEVGDVAAFAWVCLVSGLGLGADLLVPGAMAADLGKALGRPGCVFGLWNFASKLNLALAAGLSLPLLGFLGYVPGGSEALGTLSLTYAGLPLGLKVLALICLWRSRLLIEEKP